MPEDLAPSQSLSVDGLLGILEKVDPSSEFFRRSSEILEQHLLAAPPAWLLATPRRSPDSPGGRPLLAIGMATYDDYDGVYFSIQAIRLYHPEILPFVEFIVVDNHPARPLRQGAEGPREPYPPLSLRSVRQRSGNRGSGSSLS